MKSFALDENGDLLIVDGVVQMVNGEELVRQSVEKVLSTFKGEWPLDIDEGITGSNILGKPKNEEIVKNEILQGLLQVDSSFFIDSFSYNFDQVSRKLIIGFTARNENGETIETTIEY